MSFYVPSALLGGKVVRKKQGALLFSGWRAEGALGLVVRILGLMNARYQRSFLGSWNG